MKKETDSVFNRIATFEKLALKERKSLRSLAQESGTGTVPYGQDPSTPSNTEGSAQNIFRDKLAPEGPTGKPGATGTGAMRSYNVADVGTYEFYKRMINVCGGVQSDIANLKELDLELTKMTDAPDSMHGTLSQEIKNDYARVGNKVQSLKKICSDIQAQKPTIQSDTTYKMVKKVCDEFDSLQLKFFNRNVGPVGKLAPFTHDFTPTSKVGPMDGGERGGYKPNSTPSGAGKADPNAATSGVARPTSPPGILPYSS